MNINILYTIINVSGLSFAGQLVLSKLLSSSSFLPISKSFILNRWVKRILRVRACSDYENNHESHESISETERDPKVFNDVGFFFF